MGGHSPSSWEWGSGRGTGDSCQEAERGRPELSPLFLFPVYSVWHPSLWPGVAYIQGGILPSVLNMPWNCPNTHSKVCFQMAFNPIKPMVKPSCHSLFHPVVNPDIDFSNVRSERACSDCLRIYQLQIYHQQ